MEERADADLGSSRTVEPAADPNPGDPIVTAMPEAANGKHNTEDAGQQAVEPQRSKKTGGGQVDTNKKGGRAAEKTKESSRITSMKSAPRV